ncbi:MAG TPA: hypothetical protein EYP85_00295 [Armatimonadetes bacterium]|nr:hypothetical protein [Armatimonadota bacterium]
MKTLLIVCGGAADEPQEELDGETPLAAARLPRWNDLARQSLVGLVQLVPSEEDTGSDRATAALLGYDPVGEYTGRGAFDFRGIGGKLGEREVALRVDLLSFDGERLQGPEPIPDSAATAPLFRLLAERLGTRRFHLYPFREHRGLAYWGERLKDVKTLPPHRVIGRPLEEVWPTGEGEEYLRRLSENSIELLAEHDFNRARLDKGQAPLNILWPWGIGRAPKWENFVVRHRVAAALVSATPAVRGGGYFAGLAVQRMDRLPAERSRRFRQKAALALRTLARSEWLLVHVHAPDEAGHAGKAEEKVAALEDFDAYLLNSLWEGLRGEEYQMLVLADYACPITTRQHRSDPVPFCLYRPQRFVRGPGRFSELDAADTGVFLERARELQRLLRG